SGQWTYDVLLSIAKEITNMNGDSSYKWNKDGNAVYGISSHGNAADKFILGANEYFIEKDASGSLAFTANDERFYNVLTDLAFLMDAKNGYTIFGSNEDFDADNGGYVYIFQNSRSLFLTAEIKAAQLLRDMDETFGIVPYPKYDASQEGYASSFVNQCFYYSIPTTNSHIEETTVISDYISYLSYRDVLPVYYSNVVEQKGLRNDDSIEMLNIILSTKSVDLGILFGWTNTMLETIRPKLFAGATDLVSTIEKQQPTIEKNIAKTLEAIRTAQENG
ncbi:MAG: hypothetical protein ACI3XM_09605, partial [Eubacteriales bacterium]